jgi:serine/threonine protein kinase
MHDGNPPGDSTVANDFIECGGSASTGAEKVPLRYRPERFHAKGGLGEVWLAQDQELHRDVALKRIQSRYRDDVESRRRFLLEAEITGRLEHPGVVPVYGLYQGGDGQPCYAMRFIHGQTLQEAIKHFHEADTPGRDPGERSVAFRQLLSRFVAVCNTVGYAHSRGILHRDLKPANIMLGRYGETLVVDWGLAKPFARGEEAQASGEETLAPSGESGEGSTLAGHALGTPAYMSPEQAAGRWSALGPASDVYSLGATLYVLLTGRPPFEGRTDEILARVQAGQFTSPEQVKRDTPPALGAVCCKAMATELEDRYASALELAAEIERWLADEPVQARRETVREKLQRWCKRHPSLAALVVLFAVGDVTLLGSLVATLGWSGALDSGFIIGFAVLVLFSLFALLLMQVTAVLGGLIGATAGVLRRLVHGAGAVQAGSWMRFGARCGLVAGFPIGAVISWSILFSTALVNTSVLQGYGFTSIVVLFRTAMGVGVAGPVLGPVVGVLLTLRRGRWRAGLAFGAIIGPLLGLSGGGVLLSLALMQMQARIFRAGDVVQLNFSADGKQMVTGSRNGQVAVWDGVTGEVIWKKEGHPSSDVRQAVFSGDGRRVASVATDGSLYVWDSRTGEPITTLSAPDKGVSKLLFDHDGNRLVGVSALGPIHVWDVQRGQEVRSLPSQRGPVFLMAFSPDGQRVATFGQEGMRVISGFQD